MCLWGRRVLTPIRFPGKKEKPIQSAVTFGIRFFAKLLQNGSRFPVRENGFRWLNYVCSTLPGVDPLSVRNFIEITAQDEWTAPFWTQLPNVTGKNVIKGKSIIKKRV